MKVHRLAPWFALVSSLASVKVQSMDNSDPWATDTAKKKNIPLSLSAFLPVYDWNPAYQRLAPELDPYAGPSTPWSPPADSHAGSSASYSPPERYPLQAPLAPYAVEQRAIPSLHPGYKGNVALAGGSSHVVPGSLSDTRKGWGLVGQPNFGLHTYPLDLKAFRHNYEEIETDPADFREFININDRNLKSSTGVFFPEHKLLHNIQAEVHRRLARKGLPINKVFEQNGRILYDAQFLWPPVVEDVHDTTRLEMDYDVLTKRVLVSIVPKIKQNKTGWTLYYLPVNVDGEQRHVLAHMVKPASWTGFVADRFKTSQLWHLFEGRWEGGQRRLAFLGAMFLPGAAHKIFEHVPAP